jgi:hypothetical protein
MVFNTGAIALTVSVLTLAATTALRSRSLPAISSKVLFPFAVSLFVPAVIPLIRHGQLQMMLLLWLQAQVKL